MKYLTFILVLLIMGYALQSYRSGSPETKHRHFDVPVCIHTNCLKRSERGFCAESKKGVIKDIRRHERRGHFPMDSTDVELLINRLTK